MLMIGDDHKIDRSIVRSFVRPFQSAVVSIQQANEVTKTNRTLNRLCFSVNVCKRYQCLSYHLCNFFFGIFVHFTWAESWKLNDLICWMQPLLYKIDHTPNRIYISSQSVPQRQKKIDQMIKIMSKYAPKHYVD